MFLLCFARCSRASFSNVSEKWAPELRHHCPTAPILLLGLKSDLPAQVSEEEAHAMATQIGAAQYLSVSSLTQANVSDVLPLAVRTVMSPPRIAGRQRGLRGLIERARGRSHAEAESAPRNVRPPPPTLPQPEHAPYINISTSTYGGDLKRMLAEGAFADVVLAVDGVEYPAHRLVLAAAAKYFRLAFDIDAEGNMCAEERLLGATGDRFSVACSKVHLTSRDLAQTPSLLPVCNFDSLVLAVFLTYWLRRAWQALSMTKRTTHFNSTTW